MVVLDDLGVALRRLRIRPGGSSGGHNGLNYIERALGTDQYPRLRIGIDALPPFVPGKRLRAPAVFRRAASARAGDRKSAQALDDLDGKRCHGSDERLLMQMRTKRKRNKPHERQR